MADVLSPSDNDKPLPILTQRLIEAIRAKGIAVDTRADGPLSRFGMYHSMHFQEADHPSLATQLSEFIEIVSATTEYQLVQAGLNQLYNVEVAGTYDNHRDSLTHGHYLMKITHSRLEGDSRRIQAGTDGQAGH